MNLALSTRTDFRRERWRWQRGFSLIELLVTVAIIGILAATAVPSYSQLRRRFYDATALSDVVNAGKALEAMDGMATFTERVRGPGPLTNVAGPWVSAGTRLRVRRRMRRGQPWYNVRGVHRSGDTIYFFRNGKLFSRAR